MTHPAGLFAPVSKANGWWRGERFPLRSGEPASSTAHLVMIVIAMESEAELCGRFELTVRRNA
ncbi:MAG TPA: hypothetical protein VGP63_10245, partial [Planctomycetaceae bacterium]|nr:hypothetical protein [Planctomycetaceae bacterium]